MFRLDYLSCLLTIGSTVLVGRRLWHGWLVAGANSLIICYIGLKTSQTGFIPANLFCLAMYAYNIMQWRTQEHRNPSGELNASHIEAVPQHRLRKLFRLRSAADDTSLRIRDRVHARRLRGQR
ncbi:MAG TPA: hypothetical protein VMU24_05675 [Candidatus Acidoferrales bacterium]|nr:hypothetical protein [Candidatus Acidoferrales bacterium]